MLKKIITHYRLKKAMLRAMRDEAEKTPSHFDNAIIEWSAPLRHKPKKGAAWFIVMSFAVAALLFYAIDSQNWIFAVAIIVATVAYLVDHTEERREIEIKISECGIKIGKKKIPYSNIRAFWMLYHPPFLGQLHIRTHQKTSPDFIIELGDADPVRLRKYLTRHIIEWEGKEEGLLDICTRLLRL